MGLVLAPSVLFAVASIATFLLGRIADKHNRRHRNTQAMVNALAHSRKWPVLQRSEKWESGWKSHPFADLRNVVVSPATQGMNKGAMVGAGYLEGDLALANTNVRMIASRIAFVDTGVALPTAVFVGQGFKDEVAKLFGGKDLDVESHAFNKEWRILTDEPAGTHGVLTPRLIEFLMGARQPRTAINLDGTRIVVWDDGTRTDVDLQERLEFLEGFVERLPCFLKPKR